jgi:hypothetical protein
MSGETTLQSEAARIFMGTDTQDVRPAAPSNQPPSGVPYASDVFPDFAASPEEVTRRTAMLRDYVAEHMREGEDYGIVPGGSKPTLFKPGAEKLNAVFGFSPMLDVSHRIEDWDNGFVAYEVKVTLVNKRTGGVEAEGVGSCNSRERRYKNHDAANIANTILKLAKKRALIDATLSATRASGMFTQDLEDMEFEPERDYARPRVENRPADPRPQEPARAPEARAPMQAPAPEGLTQAQRGAILTIAGRVFGRHSRDEDLARLIDKPLDQLTKGEASALIDRLRGMLNEPAPQRDGEMTFTRAADRSNRNGSAN